jgi:hypothetical protein
MVDTPEQKGARASRGGARREARESKAAID